MAIFIALNVVMVSLVYEYVQTHQILYIKYAQFFCTSITHKKNCKKKMGWTIWLLKYKMEDLVFTKGPKDAKSNNSFEVWTN